MSKFRWSDVKSQRMPWFLVWPFSFSFLIPSIIRNSSSIPEESPLGCILNNWKGFKLDGLKQKKFTFFCNKAWHQYELGDTENWPENGTLNYNTILQLDLFCKQEGKRTNSICTGLHGSLLRPRKEGSYKIYDPHTPLALPPKCNPDLDDPLLLRTPLVPAGKGSNCTARSRAETPSFLNFPIALYSTYKFFTSSLCSSVSSLGKRHYWTWPHTTHTEWGVLPSEFY